ncbi:MAG TPA: glycoside hydrolase domain-containing protein, partial [Edaphobacter sp.]|nr:glycoside hydrolase domain-containing protein [Edaphobacter sp.]
STRFAELTGPGNETIPATAWSCINTDIVNVHGTPSHRDVKAKREAVVPLWCGVQIPLDAKPGHYSGSLFVIINGKELPVAIELTIKHDFIRAGGADQGWRLARLGWLNSRIGLDDTVTAPYTPIKMQGEVIHCLGREICLGKTGLPVSIRANGKELLAGPVVLSINGQPFTSKGTSSIESASDAKLVIVSTAKSGSYTLRVRTTIEFDGGTGFDVTLSSEQSKSVSGVALEIAFPGEAVPYAVGMALKGGARPQSWQWKWSKQPERWKDQGSNREYFIWMGDIDAGLYCRLTSPLDDWKNGNSGSVSFAESNGRVTFRATSGARNIRANEDMHYSFRLLPTPVKPLAPDHWKYRYAHAYQPPAELKALGATINNIHQGTLPNMYINYPFLNLDLLGPYVSESHALGIKVKIYYTMRELSTRLPELWAFRSLGDEIYRVGGTQGQGNPQLDFWLQEHLRHQYSPGWITLTPMGDIDTSLRVYSGSRLANFYLEGLKWLLHNVPIDGVYLDEIGYSRATMQRVRRVLEQHPGAMIDMHGNHDWWSCNCPIGYYMEHLPYIDRLWLGEGFNPDSPPDFWLIEMSGIPFGVSSDLLEKPNPWRGMLFGMTNRALYSGPLPTPIWKVWDNFGIEDASMIGWWDKDVPVKTGHKDVLATVYRRPGKLLIAIASWASKAVNIKLAIDWSALDLEKSRAKLSAPEMGYFQSAHDFSVEQSILIPAGKGCLLRLEQ